MGCKPGLISVWPVSSIGPGIGSCAVGRDHFAKLRFVLARAVGCYSLADEAKALIDSGMVVLAKTGGRNVDLRLAVSSHAGFGELHGSSGILTSVSGGRSELLLQTVRLFFNSRALPIATCRAKIPAS